MVNPVRAITNPVRTAFGNLLRELPVVGGAGGAAGGGYTPAGSPARYSLPLASGLLSSMLDPLANYVGANVTAVPFLSEKQTPKGDWQPDLTHPAYLKLTRPNGKYAWDDLLIAMAIDLKFRGSGIIYIDRGGDVTNITSEPEAFWWQPASGVTITYGTRDASGRTKRGYRFQGFTGLVPPENVIHVVGRLDNEDELGGYTPLRHLGPELYADQWSLHLMNAVMYNLALTPLIGMPALGEAPLSEAELETARRFWSEAFSRDNAGKPAMLAHGMSIVMPQWNINRLNILEVKEQLQRRVAGSFGFHPQAVGMDDSTLTYSNFATARRATIENVMLSLWRTIASGFTNKLFFQEPAWQSETENWRFRFSTEQLPVVQEELDALHRRAREDYAYGGITLNEWRKQINQLEIPGGEKFITESERNSLITMLNPIDKSPDM